MKKNTIFTLLMLFIFLIGISYAQEKSNDFPVLKGPYLGQAPPASDPKLFAPDIVSSANGDDKHGSIAFMPDGREIYWNMRGKIWMTKLLNDRWTEPEIASFCEDGLYMYDNPFITPDGQKMFFTSTRPGSVSEKKRIFGL
jgi:hypothetical protein